MTTSLPISTCSDSPSDLVITQVNFGLAYAREARSAYDSGRNEYGDLARDIAMRAYSTAVRFSARLSAGASRSLAQQLATLEAEVDGLLAPDGEQLRSIA